MSQDQEEFHELMAGVGRNCPEACRNLVLLYAEGLKITIRHLLKKQCLLRRHFDSSDVSQWVLAGFFGSARAREEWAKPKTLAGYLANMARNVIWKEQRKYLDCQKRDLRREESLSQRADHGHDLLADPHPTSFAAVVLDDFWAHLLRSVPEMH
jgi:hypothetical protein